MSKLKKYLIVIAACVLLGACCRNSKAPDTILPTEDDAILALGDPVEDAVEEVLPLG